VLKWLRGGDGVIVWCRRSGCKLVVGGGVCVCTKRYFLVSGEVVLVSRFEKRYFLVSGEVVLVHIGCALRAKLFSCSLWYSTHM